MIARHVLSYACKLYAARIIISGVIGDTVVLRYFGSVGHVLDGIRTVIYQGSMISHINIGNDSFYW